MTRPDALSLHPPAGKDWHREVIKAQLRILGTSLADLAERNGYAPSSFYHALVRPWPAVEGIIARALGRRPEDVWPSRYDSRGKSLTGRRTKRIRRQVESHRQFGGVA